VSDQQWHVYVSNHIVCVPQRVAEIVDFYVKYFVLQHIENLHTDTSQLPQMIQILLFSICGGGIIASLALC
jgi:hypothetical protein